MKRHFKIVFFLFLVNNGSLLSQTNLVPNPSFEIFSQCPTGVNNITATGWQSTPNGTADYFNSCAPVPTGVNVPFNQVGFQNAASGSGYCGFITYGNGSNYREILETQLSSPLVISQKYFVSIKISYGGSNPSYNGIATNNIGVKFSVTPYVSSSISIDNIAHIYSSTVISDSLNWTVIQGSFISDSAYQYVNIGNFFDDLNTDTAHINQSSNNYYFLDDVCISTDSALCSIDGFNEDSTPEVLQIYPNPATNQFTIKNHSSFEIEGQITDLIGKLISKTTVPQFSSRTIDCSLYSDGVYILQFKDHSYKIVVQH